MQGERTLVSLGARGLRGPGPQLAWIGEVPRVNLPRVERVWIRDAGAVLGALRYRILGSDDITRRLATDREKEQGNEGVEQHDGG